MAEQKLNLLDETVAGRARYKGRVYYLAGYTPKGSRGQEVHPVMTRDGQKYLLYFRDGTSKFWALRSLVEIIKSYERPRTIRELKRFAESQKRAKAEGFVDAAHRRAEITGTCRVRGCAQPAAPGREGYCEQCYFDEFDC